MTCPVGRCVEAGSRRRWEYNLVRPLGRQSGSVHWNYKGVDPVAQEFHPMECVLQILPQMQSVGQLFLAELFVYDYKTFQVMQTPTHR